jgi:hypothetical protein
MMTGQILPKNRRALEVKIEKVKLHAAKTISTPD